LIPIIFNNFVGLARRIRHFSQTKNNQFLTVHINKLGGACDRSVEERRVVCTLMNLFALA
jgi:hypothetical protein